MSSLSVVGDGAEDRASGSPVLAGVFKENQQGDGGTLIIDAVGSGASAVIGMEDRFVVADDEVEDRFVAIDVDTNVQTSCGSVPGDASGAVVVSTLVVVGATDEITPFSHPERGHFAPGTGGGLQLGVSTLPLSPVLCRTVPTR